MEKKHKNLRDVGLSLCVLGDAGARPLRCGRVLRCGVIDGCSHEELRRPSTIVNLRMGEEGFVHESLAANQVDFLHIPAENRLEKYDTTDPEVQEWLLTVLRVFEREDLRDPVLVHCRSGKDRTGVVIASLLLILGVPEALIVREFLLSEGAEEHRIRITLAGIKKAGGPEKYFGQPQRGQGLNLDQIRKRFSDYDEASETRWLQQEVQLFCRLARDAAKQFEPEEATYWQREVVGCAKELAGRVPPAEAAAACFYRGWGLGQLQRAEEAREVLSIGLALSEIGKAKEQVAKNLERELGTLPEGDELRVLEVSRALEAQDPYAPYSRTVVLTTESCTPRWRALQCPVAFGWLRAGELAASATPKAQNLAALDALGLSTRVCAEALGAPRNPEDHWDDVVSQIARVLAVGSGCLVHCTNGFGASGVALACFLVIFGLDEPVKANRMGQPSMTAGEATQVLRTLRPGCLAHPDEESQVYGFAQAAWGKHVEKAQRAFVGSTAAASSAPQRSAPPSARVVQQPGDGNCLFHSLAFGLGHGTHATLRSEICSFMERNPELCIAGTSLAEWIQMLAGSPVPQYARKMAKGAQWGGAPEIAVCAHMCKVNIHVYERKGTSFNLSVPFDVGGTRTVNILYVGGVHYDALVM